MTSVLKETDSQMRLDIASHAGYRRNDVGGDDDVLHLYQGLG